MIVSDAGQIIIFARIGRLDLLQETLGSLLVPDAVYEEIVVNKGGMPGAEGVAQAACFARRWGILILSAQPSSSPAARLSKIHRAGRRSTSEAMYDRSRTGVVGGVKNPLRDAERSKAAHPIPGGVGTVAGGGSVPARAQGGGTASVLLVR